MSSTARIITIGVLLGLLLGAQTSFACSCAERTVVEQFEVATHVFIAYIVSAESDAPAGVRGGHVRARFRVIETLKGSPTDLKHLVSDAPGGSCGAPFTIGVEMLVFADKNGDINICNGTRLTQSTEFPDTLQTLRQLANKNGLR